MGIPESLRPPQHRSTSIWSGNHSDRSWYRHKLRPWGNCAKEARTEISNQNPTLSASGEIPLRMSSSQGFHLNPSLKSPPQDLTALRAQSRLPLLRVPARHPSNQPTILLRQQSRLSWTRNLPIS